MRGSLAVLLTISICAIAAASIRDFVIESEDDLWRLGQANEVSSLGEENDEYSDDDADLMMYDGCDNAAAHPDIYDMFTGIGTSDNDNDRDNDEDCDEDGAGNGDANDFAISLRSVTQNGQLNVRLLQRAIRKLSKDPRLATIFEHAHLHDGIPSDMHVQEDYASCQSPGIGVDMISNTDMSE